MSYGRTKEAVFEGLCNDVNKIQNCKAFNKPNFKEVFFSLCVYNCSVSQLNQETEPVFPKHPP